jgi:hypothetical protein
MKKNIYTTIIACLTCIGTLLAQAPEKMSYQAVVRDASNALVATQAVGMQISILQTTATGTAVYVETQSPTTNINGLVSIEIGSGTVVSGTFNSIDWSNGPYFIKTETDPTGGITYSITGTSQLMSVPYALHANTADSIVGGVSITETDPIFSASIANGITGADTTNWNNHFNGQYNSLTGTPTNVSSFTNDAGYITTEIDGSTTNEIQVLSISNDTVYLSNGGFVKLPAQFNGQYGSLTGTPTNVSSFTNDAGYLTTEIDGSTTNEIQVLSISNDTVYLSNGGFAKLPAQFDGQYGSLTGTPTNVSSFTNDAGYLTTEIDGSTTNEIQVLSISNDTVYLSNGGFAKLPAKFDGQYNSLTGTPTNVSSFTNDATYLTSANDADNDPNNEIELPTGGLEGQVLTINAGTPQWVTPSAPASNIQDSLDLGITPCQLTAMGFPVDSLYGKTWAGGLIFYFDAFTCQGLVSAPTDQSTGAPWGCLGLEVAFFCSSDIIPASGFCPNPCFDPGSASQLCTGLINGYTGWFLPTISQLDLMYRHLHLRGIGGFASNYYWSSTESDDNYAWLQNFNFGYQDNHNKSGPGYVRAVRAF